MATGMSRHELTNAVIERKEALWKTEGHRYNDRRSAENVVYGVGKNGPPDIALLKFAANATDAELLTVINRPEYSFLFYK
jgi:hypothetical protein